MTLNLIFVTITIKTKNKTAEQYQHEEEVFKRYEQYKDKQFELGVRGY